MKKLYFFDVDGTLIDFKHGIRDISENLRGALKVIKDRGDMYFICSGRAFGTLPETIKAIGASGYSLCAGAYVNIDGNVLRNKYFSQDDLKFMMDRFSKFETFIILECGLELYTNMADDVRVIEQMKYWGIDPNNLKPIKDVENLKVNKISITFRNLEDTKCMDDFKDRGITVLVQPSEDSFDITLEDSTKEDGIRSIREYLEKELSDDEEIKIIAFGDSYNDVEMVRYADIGVAMGNAIDKLKKEADYVTTPVWEDGIYEGLKKLGEI